MADYVLTCACGARAVVVLIAGGLYAAEAARDNCIPPADDAWSFLRTFERGAGPDIWMPGEQVREVTVRADNDVSARAMMNVGKKVDVG